MKDRRHLLKIKIKSLAAEARIIRREENKRKLRTFDRSDAYSELPADLAALASPDASKQRGRWFRNWQRAKRREHAAKPWFGEAQEQLQELHIHRTFHLRRESRASGLAYGFIRGLTLEQIEGPLPERNDRGYSLPNGLKVSHDELGVFDKAADLATRYGQRGVPRSDAVRLFFDWIKSRDVVLSIGDTIALAPPEKKPIQIAQDAQPALTSS